MTDQRLEFIGLLNDAWSMKDQVHRHDNNAFKWLDCGYINGESVDSLIVMYDRLEDTSKDRLLAMVKLMPTWNWNHYEWVAVYDRLTRYTYDDYKKKATENQVERAAIIEYDADVGRFTAEDIALGREG